MATSDSFPESETAVTERPRFDVFLSHGSSDKPAVELIGRHLEEEEGLAPFLDKWHLIPGSPWQEALEEALDESAAVAVFFGPTGLNPWHNEEMRSALSRAVRTRDEYRVIPVLLPGADEDALEGFLARRTWVDFRAGLDDAEAFERLVAGIRGEAIRGRGYELPDDPAPYRGLRRFEAAQAEFFFGRDQEVTSLLDKVERHPFVAVVGASGSGKSSLVLAGLLPALAEGALPGSRSWHTLRARPGTRPLRALAEQLATLGPAADRLQRVDELTQRMATRDDGLASAASALLADRPRRLLLVIDQFEELFTHGRDEPERQQTQAERLIVNLHEAVRQLDRVRVIISLRADFLERCLRFPRLKDMLQDRQMLLGPLDEEVLRDVIVRPAQMVGALFEKGLVSAILRDVQAQPGALPLLQHALYELWRARRGPWLTLEAYEESGGVSGALQRRAQATLEALPESRQDLARNIFLRLTALGEGVSDTRRRVQRQELYLAGADRSEVDAVLDSLSSPESRLIVVDDETVEVTHEALIRQWDTLRDWLEADREALHVHRRLTRAAREWQELDRDSSALYGGARLKLAEEWAAGNTDSMNPLEAEFLSISGGHQKSELEQLHRRNLVLKGAVTAVGILAVVALVFLLIARSRQTEILSTYARGLLLPMGHDSLFMGAIESDALWDLATAEDDEIRIRFLDNGLSSASKALQLQNRLDYVVHAAVGLNTRVRARVLAEVVRPKLRQAETPRQVREVCIFLGAELGDESTEFARHASRLILEAAVDPPATTDLGKLGEAAPKVVTHLSEKDSADFVEPLIAAIEKVEDWAHIAPLVEAYFAQAVAKVEPDLASRLAEAWVVEIFEKTLMSGPGDDARASLSSMLPYISQKLGKELCVQALEASLQRIGQGASTDESISYWDAVDTARVLASRFSKEVAGDLVPLALDGMAMMDKKKQEKNYYKYEEIYQSAFSELDATTKASVRTDLLQRLVASETIRVFVRLLEGFFLLEGTLEGADADKVADVAAGLVFNKGDFTRFRQERLEEIRELTSRFSDDLDRRLVDATASYEQAFPATRARAFLAVRSSLSPDSRASAFGSFLETAESRPYWLPMLRGVAKLATGPLEDSEQDALERILVAGIEEHFKKHLQEMPASRWPTEAFTTAFEAWKAIDRGGSEKDFQDQGLQIGRTLLNQLDLNVSLGYKEPLRRLNQPLHEVAVRLDASHREALAAQAAETVRQRAATANRGELRGIFDVLRFLAAELGDETLYSQLVDVAGKRLEVMVAEVCSTNWLRHLTPIVETGLPVLSGAPVKDRVVSAWVSVIQSLPAFEPNSLDRSHALDALVAVAGVLEKEASNLLARDYAVKLSDFMLAFPKYNRFMQGDLKFVATLEGRLRSDLESEWSRIIEERALQAPESTVLLAMTRWMEAVATVPEIDRVTARTLGQRSAEILRDNPDSEDLGALTEILEVVASSLPPGVRSQVAEDWVSQTGKRLRSLELEDRAKGLSAMAELLERGSRVFGPGAVVELAEESAGALLSLQAAWYSDLERFSPELEDVEGMADTMGTLTALLDDYESLRWLAAKVIEGFKGENPAGAPSYWDQRETYTESLFEKPLVGLLALMKEQELIELLKIPTCVGPVREAVLGALAARVGREGFPSVWDVVAWVDQEEPGRFDLNSLPAMPVELSR